MLHRTDEDESNDFHVAKMIIIQASNCGAIDLEMAVSDPAKIFARTIVPALEFHIGTKRQWRASILSSSQVVVKVQVPNLVDLVGTNDVSSPDVGVGDSSFRIVDLIEIGDATLAVDGHDGHA